MKFSKLFTNIIFSLLLLPLALYPQYEIPNIQFVSNLSNNSSILKALSDRPISYDDVLELLDEIESGSIADCSEEELERLTSSSS